MRLIMMGTGPFGAPTFKGLFETHHQVLLLVTAPLRPLSGRADRPISPLRDIAHEHGVPIFDPENVNTPEAQAHLAAHDADLLVVCDYGQILSGQILATARLGGVNLHGSLLPKYRGAAPINWALYHGETETGVTVIHMTPQVDAGPCVGQVRVPIDPDETAVQLEARLAEIGAWLVRRVLDNMEAGQLEALPQDPTQATKAPRLKKEHGRIDWSRSALAIKNHVRAMEPWPKCYTYWHRPGGPPLRLILGWPVQVLPNEPTALPHHLHSPPEPGTVVAVEPDRLLVAAGEGLVGITSLQPAGKKMLPVRAFLCGYRIRPGDRLGPAPEEQPP